MRLATRYTCAWALVLLSLVGCQPNSASVASWYFSQTADVQAVPSIEGMVQASVGGRQSLYVDFSGLGIQQIRNLEITGGLPLPSGWSGPSSFSCSELGRNGLCVLSLTYTPASSGSGTLSFTFAYVDEAGYTRVGKLSIPYRSSSNNNIVATAAPSGQINAVIGAGSQNVGVAFTTDDGNPATNFSLTSSLGSLPAGWSSSASAFGCASVSTGNGCELSLTYAPTVMGSGVLTLAYSYIDNAGQSKSGALNIPYASATNNSVIGTAAPSGQIAVSLGGSQSATVTFDTNDGNAATALSITSDLTSLPSGWSSASSSFSCAAVSTGNGCQLAMTYAPTAVGSGSLTLQFSYTNDAGNEMNGLVIIPYVASTNDNVVGSPSPSGQINAVIAGAAQAVTVSFTTDDGYAASNLALTSDLSSLPSGWSSPSGGSFGCASVSTGSACQLSLSYAPSALGNGTLNLSYSYFDDAGVAKSGTVNIPYLATTNDTVIGTAAPAGTLNVAVNASQGLTVTFSSSDGNVATGLSVTSNLGLLPSGWSSPSGGSFGCPSVSTGTGCQLSLTYAPTVAATATLTVNYSYTNNAGSPENGSVSIPYTSNATIGGTLTGLNGTVSLQDNGADTLVLPGNGPFSFATALASGASYNVTVSSQPTGQTCTVSSGSGTVTTDVSSVAVSCSTNTYSIGGSISGLTASGLVITDNGGNASSISSGTNSFTFATPLSYGATYSVAVSTQPTGQTCTVSSASGTVTGSVTGVSIGCTVNTYNIGGSISGLTYSGLVITDNGGNSTSISSGAASFTFSTQIAYGNTYSVAVSTQPTEDTCTVSNGSGTVTGTVNNVSISCTINTYTIGGSISGLSASGLVITDNAGNATSISSGATSFTFSHQIAYGNTYAVAVSTQPTGQTCTVSSGSGTVMGIVNNVSITCTTNTYTIGGSISGLSQSGLVITDNGGNVTSISSGATSFTFSTPIAYGNAYSVAVSTQPTGETCTVSSGSGTATATVTTVSISCSLNTYSIGGTISGLSQSGLVLTDNGGNALSVISGSSSFTFSTQLSYGATYTVAVNTQPTGQTCTVSSGSGTVTGAVTSVSVSCTTNTYSIGGTISGLSTNGLVLTDNGGNALSVISGSSSFTFSTQLSYGATYAVAVSTQPSGQSCTVSNGSGTATAAVTSVTVSCVNTYTIGGTISGLTMSSVVLANGSQTVTVSSGSSSWVFSNSFTSGSSYSVSVQMQPAGEFCQVTSGASGTLSANVSNVTVACAPTYGYGYYKSITVKSGQVSGGPLTNYPLLVSSTDPDLATVANGGKVTNANGYDIIFVALDDTTCGGTGLSPCTLYHENEGYNAATGQLIAWVNVPSISSSTVIYAYFGNSSVTTATAQPTNVWDSNYVLVSHLPNGTTLSAADSTSDANNGAFAHGNAVAGEIGGGFQSVNASYYINYGTHASMGNFTTLTYEFWMNVDGNNYGLVAGHYSSADDNDVTIHASSPHYLIYNHGWSTTSGAWHGSTALSASTWYHVAVTYNGGSTSNVPQIYINGVADTMTTTTTPAGSLKADSGDIWWLAGHAGSPTTGEYDEVRYSNIVRSAGWFATEYNNQSAPSSFYTLGSTVTQ